MKRKGKRRKEKKKGKRGGYALRTAYSLSPLSGSLASEEEERREEVVVCPLVVRRRSPWEMPEKKERI